jgi:hypothetical protein
MIKRLLRWLWCPGPCLWKTIAKVDIYSDFSGSDLPVAHQYEQQCETCGIIRRTVC